MKKKSLEEKIRHLCWWALGLSILYFVIGACLKSDGSKFDPAKTYDLIKDTLTLTATFLAPVAGFVLFSDWRQQHVLIKQERLNENFYLITRRVSRKLFKLANELTNRDNKNFKQQSVEVDDCITELWDTLFNMGLSQSFSERFLANGFEIQRKFRRVFDTLKEARDEFDNYIDSNKDDEFSDIGHETTYDLQLNQTLAIADIMDEINKMLPEGLRYQVTNK